MGPNLVTTTQASRRKSRVAITAVEMKNQKNARKNCGNSAASSSEVRARSSDQTYSASPTVATVLSEATPSPPCNGRRGQGRGGALLCTAHLSGSLLVPRGASGTQAPVWSMESSERDVGRSPSRRGCAGRSALGWLSTSSYSAALRLVLRTQPR